MYSVSELYIPQTLEEALAFLSAHPDARPLAGGTDVLVAMRNKKLENLRLMSLEKLPELEGIRLREDGVLEIGARTTFTQLAASPEIAVRAPMLRTAALAMGGPQIQNRATIGGNVCNGATSADSAPGLFALDAVLVLQSAAGPRRVPITDFYSGPGRVKRESTELLLHLELPPAAPPRHGDCYLKFSTRKAMDLALIGCAAVCELAEDGTVSKAAIALGVAAPTPVRAAEAETFLLGRRPTLADLEEAGELALRSASPRSSWRASKEYREQIIRTLAKRAFRAAYETAGGVF